MTSWTRVLDLQFRDRSNYRHQPLGTFELLVGGLHWILSGGNGWWAELTFCTLSPNAAALVHIVNIATDRVVIAVRLYKVKIFVG